MANFDPDFVALRGTPRADAAAWPRTSRCSTRRSTARRRPATRWTTRPPATSTTRRAAAPVRALWRRRAGAGRRPEAAAEVLKAARAARRGGCPRNSAAGSTCGHPGPSGPGRPSPIAACPRHRVRGTGSRAAVTWNFSVSAAGSASTWRSPLATTCCARELTIGCVTRRLHQHREFVFAHAGGQVEVDAGAAQVRGRDHQRLLGGVAAEFLGDRIEVGDAHARAARVLLLAARAGQAGVEPLHQAAAVRSGRSAGRCVTARWRAVRFRAAPSAACAARSTGWAFAATAAKNRAERVSTLVGTRPRPRASGNRATAPAARSRSPPAAPESLPSSSHPHSSMLKTATRARPVRASTRRWLAWRSDGHVQGHGGQQRRRSAPTRPGRAPRDRRTGSVTVFTNQSAAAAAAPGHSDRAAPFQTGHVQPDVLGADAGARELARGEQQAVRGRRRAKARSRNRRPLASAATITRTAMPA